MINRWRLEKSDPKAKLSPPKKQIVWWVEDTVPQEYRPYVEEGILEWNKAFEKIGFRNALAVRWQNDRDEFDPEDINYCTFRWITTSSTFAMSALRSNPLRAPGTPSRVSGPQHSIGKAARRTHESDPPPSPVPNRQPSKEAPVMAESRYQAFITTRKPLPNRWVSWNLKRYRVRESCSPGLFGSGTESCR